MGAAALYLQGLPSAKTILGSFFAALALLGALFYILAVGAVRHRSGRTQVRPYDKDGSVVIRTRVRKTTKNPETFPKHVQRTRHRGNPPR